MDLKKKAIDIRKDVVKMIHHAGTGHIGGDLSVTDILVALYYEAMNVAPDKLDDPERDRFVMSKGHSVEALYAVLADRGFFPKEELESYSAYGSRFIGHPNNKIPGIEMNTGSLGHGLSIGVGMALAARMDDRSYRVYVVLGDGECDEGSVWEAAMAARHYKLDGLTAFVDRWASFGWNVLSIPGNDIEAILAGVELAKRTKGKPTVIIANTTKGSGVSFIENKAGWHHKVPSDAELAEALKELDERRSRL